MSLERKYSPKTKLYYQWLNASLKESLSGYLDGTNVRPLLMYGPPGTGKSKIAELLPTMICPDLDPTMNLLRTTGTGLTAKGMDKIVDFGERQAWNNKRMNVIIIDEVDDAAVSAMNAFKGWLDDVNTREDPLLVIMTTNHLNKISRPVQSRADCIYVPPAKPQELLAFAQNILAEEGFKVGPERLLPILGFNAENGLEYREMYKRLERFLGVLKRAATDHK